MEEKNFRHDLSEYILGIKGTEYLPEIAIKGIEEGFESDNLFKLAGLNKGDNKFEIEMYFKKAINELDYKLPTFEKAFCIVLKLHLNKLLKGEYDFDDGVNKIGYGLINYHLDDFGDKNSTWYDLFFKFYSHCVNYFDIDEDLAKGYFYKKGVTSKELHKLYKDEIIKEGKIMLNKIDKILNH